MVSAFSLWLPIVLSAVFVFIASSVIHMVLGYHAGDVKGVARQDDLMTALRGFNLAPGDYAVPKPNSMKELGTPEFKAKMAQGPAVFFTVRQPGADFMGATLGVWFVYCVVVAFVAAYITGIARKRPSGFRAVAKTRSIPPNCRTRSAPCAAFRMSSARL